MTTIFRDISAALDEHLNDMVGVPPVAWENLKYEPTLGTLYLRATNLQGETIADTENDKTVGVYQIDIFSALGEGKNESIAMADTLTDRFSQDTELTYNSQMVRVRHTSRLGSRATDDGWLMTTINVSYYSHSARR